MTTCRFCLKDDLPDQATKCCHCGSWLNDQEDRNSLDALRKEVREELKDDLLGHREYLKSLFNRVQFGATIILTLAIGAAVFFGFKTDRSIDEVSEHIKDRIAARLQEEETHQAISKAINQEVSRISPYIKETAGPHIKTSVSERLQAEDTKAEISEAIKIEVDKLSPDMRADAKSAVVDMLKTEGARFDEEIGHIKSRAEADLTEIRRSKNAINEQTFNLDEINSNVEAIAQRVSHLESQQTATQLPPIDDDKKDKIVIKQEVFSEGEEDEKEWWFLTFTVDVESDDQQEKEMLLGRVDRVIYHLEEQWFKNPSRVRLNRHEEFKMAFRVFGVTFVRVDIYLKGVDEPIVREGFMSLSKTKLFRPSSG